MKLVLSLVVFLPLCVAQTLTLTGPTNVRPGQTADVTATLTGTGAVGLQWFVAIPAPLGAATATTPVSDKTLHRSTDGTINLLVGLNVTPIAPGAVARYALAIPANAPKGIYQMPLTGLLAANADGEAITLTSGAAYTLRVLARSDLNGDGLTNGVDLTLMIDQVLGRTACADDQTGDVKCNLLDVLAIVRDALQ